jgi:hypothetical protein
MPRGDRRRLVTRTVIHRLTGVGSDTHPQLLKWEIHSPKEDMCNDEKSEAIYT